LGSSSSRPAASKQHQDCYEERPQDRKGETAAARFHKDTRREREKHRVFCSGNLGSCCAVLALCETRQGTRRVRSFVAAHTTTTTTTTNLYAVHDKLSWSAVPCVGILVLVACSWCLLGSHGSCMYGRKCYPCACSLARMCVAFFCYSSPAIFGFSCLGRPADRRASFSVLSYPPPPSSKHMYVWRYGDDLQPPMGEIPHKEERGEGDRGLAWHTGILAYCGVHQPGHSALISSAGVFFGACVFA
jgi:hypothetical protein